MKQKKIINLYKILFMSVLIVSCKNKTVEEDMNDWCNCEKKASENLLILDSCNQMMIEISKKYEFDPEAVPKISKAVKECK